MLGNTEQRWGHCLTERAKIQPNKRGLAEHELCPCMRFSHFHSCLDLVWIFLSTSWAILVLHYLGKLGAYARDPGSVHTLIEGIGT